MKGMKGVIWLAIPMVLAGCDLVQDRYRMEFRDGSWREIAISPFSNEARWREGCATGEVQVDMTPPLKRGKVVNGREQLLIGGELFELEDARLYRGNGMVLGQAPTISSGASRGWMSAEPCAPDRGPRPSSRARDLATSPSAA